MIIIELDKEQLVSLIQEAVRHALEAKGISSSKTESDELLTVQDTAKFLSLSVPTIYGLISKGKLPVMKRSKRCYFSKIELINYLKAGRKKTDSEINSEAEQYLNSKK